MKKILLFFLCFLMLATMCACSIISPNTGKETAEVTDSAPVLPEGAVILELESCSFVKKIYSSYDPEIAGNFIPEKEGKIYVDCVFSVVQNSIVVSDMDFSADIEFKGEKYPFNFCYELNDNAGIRTQAGFPSNTGGKIHLFATLPAEAEEKTDLEVTISAYGEEYVSLVAPRSQTGPLEDKVLLKANTEYNPQSGLTFKLLGAGKYAYISAWQAEESKKYKGDGDVYDVVIEITNNTDEAIKKIYSYTFNEEGPIKGSSLIENADHNDLLSLSEYPLEKGQKGIVHVYLYADDSDGTLRMNIADKCYYWTDVNFGKDTADVTADVTTEAAE